MKTLEELYKEVIASDDLRKEFSAASQSKETTVAWLKKHDCSASVEDLRKFLTEKNEGEICDNEVESVAGGKADDNIVFFSVISVGFFCAVHAIASCIDDEKTTRECFQKQED